MEEKKVKLEVVGIPEGKRKPLCTMVWMRTPAWLGDHSSP